MFISLDHFKIEEIKVLVDITLCMFNIANVSHGLPKFPLLVIGS